MNAGETSRSVRGIRMHDNGAPRSRSEPCVGIAHDSGALIASKNGGVPIVWYFVIDRIQENMILSE